MPIAERALAWPDCLNARELGDLPTAGGGQTAARSIIRADSLSRLTAEGREAAFKYGARTVIDLRSPKELEREPSWSDDSRIQYLNRPLETFKPEVSALIQKATSRGEVYTIILDHYPGEMAAVMREIGRARPGGVILHCHSGKDRTGMVVALLLRLVGVPDELIVEDYAESQIRLKPYYDALPPSQSDSFWSRPTATADQMARFLAHIDRTYQGAEGYLKHAGLTESELAELKSRLV